MADQIAGDRHPARRIFALSLTSTQDGYEHLVAEDAMTVGKAGRVTALCGRSVWAAALACPPGPRCRACNAVRDTDATYRLGYRRTKQRRMLALIA
jgi:hypothetical protein